ncbi:hypothetical protein VP01_4667g3 [Puccinia sorghi]|uniref:Uncharacterized protein n=1 Tax=Puccinia sorghi TaxID=27349 RepID=A0A0L6UN73_9BASI|nr:hypothetical protein VP01_4667g3 [Puccinia sorghi]
MIINILRLAIKHSTSIQDLRVIPSNLQTLISKANLDVELTEKICCRVFFRLYEFQPTPWCCNYKSFSDSDPSHNELFVSKKIYKGHKDVGDLAHYSKPPKIFANIVATPRCVFLSQCIVTWLTWLFSRPDFEKSIEDWIQTNDKLKDWGYISEIQHGDVFTNTEWKKRPDLLQLAVSLFVDWFNPRGNKISGKVESTGILALSFLNLPPTFRNKISHMYIFGITPGPHSPNPQTFNHILSPMVDELIQLNTGILIATHQYPSSYAYHAATKFCPFCHEENSNIPNLKLSKEDEKKKKQFLQPQSQKKPMYWDLSRNVVLGVMHNCLEGILQGHFHYCWKFGCVPPNQAQIKRRNDSRANSGPIKQERITIEPATMQINDEDLSSKSDDDENEDILLNGGSGGGFFSEDDVERFCTKMKQVFHTSPEILARQRMGN